MSEQSSIDRIENLSQTIESFVASKDLFIVMVDLCNSTSIKQLCLENSLPDSLWIVRQRLFLARAAKLIRDYRGLVIKTIGDEVMATFDSDTRPVKIIKCCTDIFQRFNNLKQYNREKFRITARAAVDFGECVDGDVLDSKIFDPIGTCVDRCSRIAKFAEANEIVVSDEFYDLLKGKNKKFTGYSFHKLTENIPGLGTIRFWKMMEKSGA
jgi:class 3 adenylate cyclase